MPVGMDPDVKEPLLVFFVNGRKVIEPNPDPEWTLLQYLRDKLRLCGVRPACKEGGCGACTVMMSKWDPETHRIRNFAINACLAPLCTVHGTAIVTVEGLGSIDGGLHPVQERIAKSHGTQCGYCTPGFVMSMYALLRNNPQPTEQEMERAFQGNLCRCTGYRPILDGLKSFCQAENCCQKKGNKQTNSRQGDGKRAVSDVLFDPSEFKPYDPSQDPIFPPELKLNHSDYQKALVFKSDRVTWFRPTTLQSILELKEKYPESRLIAGGNDLQYEKKTSGRSYSVLIHLMELPELIGIRLEPGHVLIGSRTTFAELQSFCHEHKDENLLFRTLDRYLERFGDCQLRNTATVGASVYSGSMTSDSITFFAAAKATIMVATTKKGIEELKMDEKFFKPGGGTTVKSDQIITALKIPLLNPNEFLWASKVSRRRDVDAAILNAAIKLQFLDVKTSVVTASKFVFNGLAAGGLTFGSHYSGCCNGRVWTSETLEALKLQTNTFPHPPDEQISTTYRDALVRGFFDRFYDAVCKWKEGQFDADDLAPMPRSATQLYEIVPEDQPTHDLVGRPIVHLSALKHATGDAVFLPDIPPYANELFGAIVMSTRAHAKILSVNYTQALAMKGVVQIFDWKSLGKERNRYSTLLVADEVAFAKDDVNFYGQPIAFVVAETQEIASRAAKEVKVEYEDKVPLILTIEDAIKHESFYEHKEEIKQGDVNSAFAQCDHSMEGEFRVGGQKHFFMETDGSVAISLEDNAVEIITTTQAPKHVQSYVRQCLGMRSSEIIVKMRRLGGGFGGRETRPACLAIYTALAAKRLKRPVRCVLSRDEDMQLVGGRHAALCRYKVGFTSTGSITAIKAEVFLNGGHTLDYSPLVLGFLLRGLATMYKVPHLDLRGSICRTHTTSSTAFRGFGNPQASLMIENIMDEVATAVGRTPEEIRQQHFYHDGDRTATGYVVERSTIQRCWEEVQVQADLGTRKQAIEESNRNSRFTKRGIAATTISFPIGFPIPFLNQGGALVMIYEDGSVSLNHGGCEMGQGLHTKMMQVASRALGIPISKIHMADTSSDKVPNATTSAASMTADLNGPAIIDACQTLLKRLEPIIVTNPNGNWEEWVSAAYFSRINLSATGFNKLDFPGYFNYLTYAAGVTEVEIDCLTGEHQVLRTDIVMEVGESLNPAIDIGQIEGAFVQGMGLVTSEEVLLSSSGQLLSTGPAVYKCPMASNAPRVFNVSLLRGAPNPKAVYSSKGIGEPALLLASSVFHAIKDAIRAARVEKKRSPRFHLDSPATVQRIKLAIDEL